VTKKNSPKEKKKKGLSKCGSKSKPHVFFPYHVMSNKMTKRGKEAKRTKASK
jgi:hypothetical protein